MLEQSPVYYGSPIVDEYISSKRIIQVNPQNIQDAIREIQDICKNADKWYSKVKPCQSSQKSTNSIIQRVVDEIKILLAHVPFSVEIIGNMEAEPERTQYLQPIMMYYNTLPKYDVYSTDAYVHPLYKKFNSTKKINAISLAINHITLLRKYAYKNKFLVVFESDAMPLYSMDIINEEIQKDIMDMNKYNIDFAFIGKGCCSPLSNVQMLGEHLYVTGFSRCTESYIVSPNGIVAFLKWFDSKNEHDVIDWAYNHYFKENSTRIGCWRHPELFQQGSICGAVRSLVPI